MNNKIKMLFKILPHILLALLICHLFFFYFIRASSEPIWKSWGDAYSDNNVLISGKHFVTQGFLKLKFIPVVKENLAEGPYTGWPPLADITNGLLRKLGINTLFGFRLFSIFISLLFIIYLYRLLILLFNNNWAALIGTGLINITPYAYMFADTLHCHMYEELFLVAVMFYFIKYYKSGKTRYLSLGIFFTFLEAYVTWFYIPWMIAFFIFYPLAFKEEKSPSIQKKSIALFPLTILATLALYTLQIILVLGGIKAGLLNFYERLTVRTFDVVTGEYFKGYGSFHFVNETSPIGYITEQFKRISNTFILTRPLLFITVIFAICFGYIKKYPKELKLLLFGFIASAFWVSVFIQHTIIHGFTSRLFGVWLAMMLCFSVKFILDQLRFDWNRPRELSLRYFVTLLIALGLSALILNISRTIINNYLHYYESYVTDLDYRTTAKEHAELGLENVAFYFGTASSSLENEDQHNPQTTIDNQYTESGPNHPNNYWIAKETTEETVDFFIDLSSSAEIFEINLFCWDKNINNGINTLNDYKIDLFDKKNQTWKNFYTIHNRKYPKSQRLAGDILKVTHEIAAFTSKNIRITFGKPKDAQSFSPQLSEIEVFGRPSSNTLNENILLNSNFEKTVDKKPLAWTFSSFTRNGASYFCDEKQKVSGKNSLYINNNIVNDSRLSQLLKLSPRATYLLTGFIKTKNIVAEKESSGAHLNLEGFNQKLEIKWRSKQYVTGTKDWTKIEAEITTPEIIKINSRFFLHCRIGDYGNSASGKAWFDKLSLKRIK